MARQIHPAISEDEFSAQYRAAADEALGGAFAGDELTHLLYGIYRSLIDASAHFNLTAITEPGAVIRLHLIDSLLPVRYLADRGLIKDGSRLLDVGSGAGFPALPIAAAASSGAIPRVRITALDSTAKKVCYIRDTAGSLGLADVAAIASRAEELSHGKLRESFDIVTARAVSAMPVLIELCAPFVKCGGTFAALKGDAASEVSDAEHGATLLGMSSANVTEYRLPTGESRALVVYRKLKSTPREYPRAYAKITSSPLKG